MVSGMNNNKVHNIVFIPPQKVNQVVFVRCLFFPTLKVFYLFVFFNPVQLCVLENEWFFTFEMKLNNVHTMWCCIKPSTISSRQMRFAPEQYFAL